MTKLLFAPVTVLIAIVILFGSCKKSHAPTPVLPANSPGLIVTIAGNGTAGFSGDSGPATSAQLYDPTGVALDNSGNIYIADHLNDRIRKINTSGVITTIAGSGTHGNSGDGGAAINAELYHPTGVAVDNLGNIYIADVDNKRIRKVSTSGIITTFAGTGNDSTSGYSGDGGPATAAQLDGPFGVAVDDSGNVYIADAVNNCIRVVNGIGIIKTIAGSGYAAAGGGGYSGDGGPATAAELWNPMGVAVDNSGNIYIADGSNQRIRVVNKLGIISTLAGNGAPGYSGDDGPATAAELLGPNGVTVDNAGNVYIADQSNERIRKVNTAGVITTIAGNGYGAGTTVGGYSGDGGPGVSAELYEPLGVAVDVSGNLYIADEGNHRIRKVNH